VSDGHHPPERDGRLSERQRTKIQGRFGVVLLLLVTAVFFSISAPDVPWAFLLTTVILAANLSVAMWASSVRPKVMRAWLGVAVLGIGASIFIAITQETRVASGYLAITSLLLTLFTISAIARRLWLHSEISFLTVLGPCASTCYSGCLSPSCSRPLGILDRNLSSPPGRGRCEATMCTSASSLWPRWDSGTSQWVSVNMTHIA
jgi:hypothetical protein